MMANETCHSSTENLRILNEWTRYWKFRAENSRSLFQPFAFIQSVQFPLNLWREQEVQSAKVQFFAIFFSTIIYCSNLFKLKKISLQKVEVQSAKVQFFFFCFFKNGKNKWFFSTFSRISKIGYQFCQYKFH